MNVHTEIENLRNHIAEILRQLDRLAAQVDDGTEVVIPAPAAGWYISENPVGLRSLAVDAIRDELRNKAPLSKRAHALLDHPVFTSVFVGRMRIDDMGDAERQRDILDSLTRFEFLARRAGGRPQLIGSRGATLPPLVDYRDVGTWYTRRTPGPAVSGVLLVPWSTANSDDSELAQFVRDLVDDYLANGPLVEGAGWVPV